MEAAYMKTGNSSSLFYYIADELYAGMSCISSEIHDLVQSLFHQSGDDILVKLKDHVIPRLLENIKSFINLDHHPESSANMTEDRLAELLHVLLLNLRYIRKVHAKLIFPSMTQYECIKDLFGQVRDFHGLILNSEVHTRLIFPSMTQYELLQNVFGNLRDFHGLILNSCIERKTIEYVLPQFQLMAERAGHFCFVLLTYQLDKTDNEDGHEAPEVNSKLANLFLEVIPVELEVMHIRCTVLKASKSAEVGRFIKKLLEACPDILRESLIHLRQHMVNAITRSTSACNNHVMIEFLLIILADVPKDVICREKLFALLVRVVALTKEVFVLVRNLEENSRNEESMKETSLNLLENI